MKLLVYKKKLFIVSIMILLLLLQLLTCHYIMNMSTNYPEKALKISSWIAVGSLTIELFLWKKSSGELFSPYVFFFIVAFAFCCGQSIGWIFELDMGPKDMWNRSDHGITKYLLCEGLLYSTIGLSAFHLGALIVNNTFHKEIIKYKAEDVVATYKQIGKLMILIVIPAFFAKMLMNIITVSSGGYGAIYTRNTSYITTLISIISDYYQPCLLILLIAYKENYLYRRTIIAMMLVDVIAALYIGGRSGAVMSILGIILAYHSYIKRLTIKGLLILLGLGYVIVIILDIVAVTRGESGRTIGDIFVSASHSDSSVIGSFIGELGWSITSVCWTMELVPSLSDYRYGTSYLVSLLSWIPTPLFGNVHPVTIYGELSWWLQNSLRLPYGPGFSMMAEAYINFGWFGGIALFFEGTIMSKLLARVPCKRAQEDVIGSTFQIMIIMILTKSLVRSSVDQATRSAFFVIIPLYLLIHISLPKNGEKEK